MENKQEHETLNSLIHAAQSPGELLDSLLLQIRHQNKSVVDFLDNERVETVFPIQEGNKNLLWAAIRYDDIELVKALIVHPFYKNQKGYKDVSGFTYLTKSATLDDREHIEELLVDNHFYEEKSLNEDFRKELSLADKSCHKLLDQKFEFEITSLFRAGKFEVFKRFSEARPGVLHNSLLIDYMMDTMKSNWEIPAKPSTQLKWNSSSNELLLTQYFPAIMYTADKVQTTFPEMSRVLENQYLKLFEFIHGDEEAQKAQALYLEYFPKNKNKLHKSIMDMGLSYPWAIKLEEEHLRENFAEANLALKKSLHKI